MKNPLLWLATFVLVALPFTAAAFNYGANQPLLAAEGNGATQPAGSRPRAAAAAVLEPGAAETADHDSAVKPTPDSEPSSPGPQRTLPGPPSQHRQNGTADNPPNPEPPSSTKPPMALLPPSWRSLLPGSIQ